MSNFSTLPKGDSAWLLRKSIHRIIQQVSVLETNIGSSTTGNSANQQVIFNDNGVLRGDSDLIFNTAQNKLVALNIESAASLVVGTNATISGDLTVDTSTLKVDSANNTVGIGNASPPTGSASTDVGLALGSAGTVRSVLIGMQNCFGRIRERDAVNNLAITTNIGATGTIDDNTRTSWKVRLGSGNDNFSIQRAPIGSSTFAEFLQVNADGNLGLSVTPSAWNSGYKVFEINTTASLSATSTTVWFSNNQFVNSGGSSVYKTSSFATQYRQDNAGNHVWFNAPSGTAGNAITFTQAMTLDPSGNLLVGTTGAVVSSVSRFRVSATAVPAMDGKTTAATEAVVDEWNSDTSGNNLFNRFWTEGAATLRGSIDYNRAGGLVRYNTTSDYRAKDIIGPVSDSGSVIDSLKVYVGKMHGATIERPMLIAHELQAVAPYAVSGEKDAVDADGKPKYQQMDASSLVPLLIAEVKSLRARVQTLENR